VAATDLAGRRHGLQRLGRFPDPRDDDLKIRATIS
jgi:hypothetical protein